MFALALVMLALMITLILLGLNIAITMTVVGFVGIILAKDFSTAIAVLRQIPANNATMYTLTVIPLFVLMGNAVFQSGISDGLFEATNKWLSRMPGNLACATVFACAVFGAVCGSTIATTATIGTAAYPKMKEAGYKDTLIAGSIASGGGLGILIPPSTTMIIYGVATENSIGKLFAAGALPGILCCIVIIIQIIIMIKANPTLAPGGEKCSWIERLKSLKSLIYIVVLFLAVLGGMFSGFVTVNEAAALGAVISIIMMAMKGKLNWKNLKSITADAIKTSGMCYFCMVGAAILGSFLTLTRMPAALSGVVANLNVSRYVILAVIFLIYGILGCIMNATPMVLLTMPVFYPIITYLGFDSIWFGVFIVLIVNLGGITPPVGLNCYVLAGTVKELPLATIFRGSLPFCISILLTIIIITIFPQIATWLPSLLY